jgi:hypothetical protein
VNPQKRPASSEQDSNLYGVNLITGPPSRTATSPLATAESDLNNDHAEIRRTYVLSTTQISHFVAIERVSLGYTHADHARNELPRSVNHDDSQNKSSTWQPGHCCNMRSESIDALPADLHLPIKHARARDPHSRLRGIGDEGNEIGMERRPKEELV